MRYLRLVKASCLPNIDVNLGSLALKGVVPQLLLLLLLACLFSLTTGEVRFLLRLLAPATVETSGPTTAQGLYPVWVPVPLRRLETSLPYIQSDARDTPFLEETLRLAARRFYRLASILLIRGPETDLVCDGCDGETLVDARLVSVTRNVIMA
jgi:hypothetical protein